MPDRRRLSTAALPLLALALALANASAARARPPHLPASFSSIGFMVRHGAHHSALKCTTSGTPLDLASFNASSNRADVVIIATCPAINTTSTPAAARPGTVDGGALAPGAAADVAACWRSSRAFSAFSFAFNSLKIADSAPSLATCWPASRLFNDFNSLTNCVSALGSSWSAALTKSWRARNCAANSRARATIESAAARCCSRARSLPASNAAVARLVAKRLIVSSVIIRVRSCSGSEVWFCCQICSACLRNGANRLVHVVRS